MLETGLEQARWAPPLAGLASNTMPHHLAAVTAPQWVRAVTSWAARLRSDLRQGIIAAAECMAGLAVSPASGQAYTTAPTRHRIAAALGVSERTVSRWWARLVEVGLLVEVERGSSAATNPKRRLIGGRRKPWSPRLDRAATVWALSCPVRVAAHPLVAHGPQGEDAPTPPTPDEHLQSNANCLPLSLARPDRSTKAPRRHKSDPAKAKPRTYKHQATATVAAWPCWGRRLTPKETAALATVLHRHAPGLSAYQIAGRIEWQGHTLGPVHNPAGFVKYRLTRTQTDHETATPAAATAHTRTVPRPKPAPTPTRPKPVEEPPPCPPPTDPTTCRHQPAFWRNTCAGCGTVLRLPELPTGLTRFAMLKWWAANVLTQSSHTPGV